MPNYFEQYVYNGQTGTTDPTAAGLVPSAGGSGGDVIASAAIPPGGGGADQPLAGDVPPGLMLLRALRGEGGYPGLPSWSEPLRPPVPTPPAPPPIPGPLGITPQAGVVASAPITAAGGATDPRVLARLN